MKEKVSVIVPVYNVEQYLSTCVESILHQTYDNIEMILVDDGSTDQSGRLCDQYADKYENVITYHKKNGGLSDARNYGMQYASGQYLMFVDSDDFLDLEMIERLYLALQEEQADISVCGFRYVYEDGTEKVPYHLSDERKLYTGKRSCELIYEEPFDVLMTVVWNKLYKREYFEKITYPVGKKHEDDFTTYKILYQAKQVVFLNEALYGYRQRSGSIMAGLSGDRIIDMDILEALSERAQFMLSREEKGLAGVTLLKFLDKCIDRFDTMKKQSKYTSQECKELKKYYRQVYRLLWQSEASIVRKIYYGLFPIFEGIFLKIHFRFKYKMYPD